MMYRFFVLTALFFSFALVRLDAQAKVSNRSIRKATAEAVERYQLSDSQAPVMEAIQAQRLTNLAAIEPLKGQNYALYLQKRKAIRLYAEAATRQLLSPEQHDAFESQQHARDRREEALLRKLKNEGATAAEIERAILELEEPDHQ